MRMMIAIAYTDEELCTYVGSLASWPEEIFVAGDQGVRDDEIVPQWREKDAGSWLVPCYRLGMCWSDIQLRLVD